MAVIAAISPEIGYVFFVLIGFVFVHLWMGSRVMAARKKYNVEYPAFYGPNDDKHRVFNCIQRAHMNFVENWARDLTLIGIASIQYPFYTAILSSWYLIFRIVYFVGYSTGDPKKREWGTPAYAGLLPILVLALHTSYTLAAQANKL